MSQRGITRKTGCLGQPTTASGHKLGCLGEKIWGLGAGIKVGTHWLLGRDLEGWAEWRPELGFRPWEMWWDLWVSSGRNDPKNHWTLNRGKAILENDYNSISFKIILGVKKYLHWGSWFTCSTTVVPTTQACGPFSMNVNRLPSGLETTSLEITWYSQRGLDVKPRLQSFLRELSTQHALPPLDGMPVEEVITPCHFPFQNSVTGPVWCIYGAEPMSI